MRVLMTGVALSVLSIAASAQQPASPQASAAASRTMVSAAEEAQQQSGDWLQNARRSSLRAPSRSPRNSANATASRPVKDS